MGGIKRKPVAPALSDSEVKIKKVKVDKPKGKRSADGDAVKPSKTSKRVKVKNAPEDSQHASRSDGDAGLSSDNESGLESNVDLGHEIEKQDSSSHVDARKKISGSDGMNITTSREAHAKQKALARERKAAKPNAEDIEQLKHLWEKLRLKSNVDKEEKKKLIDQTMEIVTGRIKEFVFKHDSVRVIQSVLKYTTSMEQRKTIARELKGEFKGLAEGKYAKFLVAKLLEKGDAEIRGMIISEFYGNVRRLIGHPEAAWILDDTYRQVATPEQKSRLLREWYGPEFSIKGLGERIPETADLKSILEQFPERRKPIMDYLEVQINQLIQKRQSGFTMLHDAMLQYFLTCKPGTADANAFLEHLKPDSTLKEGEEADNVDLLKNLAFTKPGSRLVSLALAYGTAKDRKLMLRPYKDTIEMMAYDGNAHHVLLAALAVIDDTKLSSKSIFGELLPTSDTLAEKVLSITNDARARTVLLYPFAADSKWLLDDETRERLMELYAIRSTTSKKDPNVRLHEITVSIESPLLSAITKRMEDFTSFSFGLQFITEVLLGAPDVDVATRKQALQEVANHSQQILQSGDSSSGHGKNLLKTLVQGGKYDPKTKKVVPVQPPLGFADMFWGQVKKDVLSWATGQGSWVIVSLVENEDFAKKGEVLTSLKKGREQLEKAALSPAHNGTGVGRKGKNPKGQGIKGNAGARVLLEKL